MALFARDVLDLPEAISVDEALFVPVFLVLPEAVSIEVALVTLDFFLSAVGDFGLAREPREGQWSVIQQFGGGTQYWLLGRGDACACVSLEVHASFGPSNRSAIDQCLNM